MYNSVWYDNLEKPFLQPPSWIFTPVWIIFYGTLLAAVIIYSITITKKNKMNGFFYFVIHMVFNLVWSPMFFYFHRIGTAFSIIIAMIFTALLLIHQFFSVSKLAGIILFPYFLWLIFAAYLNFQFWILN